MVGVGIPLAEVGADEGVWRQLEAAPGLLEGPQGYVFAVPLNFVTLSSGRKTTAASLARLVPAAAWETRSCGRG
jgi:hypothetical protein